MKKTLYNKLVRDNIPAWIESLGKTPQTRVLSKNDFESSLLTKLQEEVDEFFESKEIVELADILEVIYALAAHQNISEQALNDMRAEKANKRGRFAKRIYLESVLETEAISQ